MEKLTEELKEKTISTFKKFGNEKALLSLSGNTYTGTELAFEIEKESKVGVDAIKRVLSLTIDLIGRDKINM